MVKEIRNVVTWLKNWFYDKNEVYQKNETYTKSEVDTSLNTKLNSNLTVANKMLVTDNNGNVVLDDKPTFEAIKVVASLPTASASTMGALYIVSENSKVNVYYTRNNNGSYSWQKMDTDILDDLSVGWNDITGKPSTFPPSSHSHTTANVTDPNQHYSLGTFSNATQSTINTAIDTQISNILGLFGGIHVYFVDVLPDTFADVDINGLYIIKENGIYKIYQWEGSNSGLLGDYGDWEFKTSIGITSIQLVPKSTDATGAIRFYYGDEP